MAGGAVKYRHLSRDSSARMALLRGLVTQLVQYEHIQTTYAKAKEAQRLAEKLITLAKTNNEPSRRRVQGILYTPHLHLPKLFGELRERYLPREGGYTRLFRTESKNTYDQGESAILELVDGPKDSRFMMTAKTLARDRLLGRESTAVTRHNVEKVTRFRSQEELETMVRRFMAMETRGDPHAASEAESPEAVKMAAKESAAAQLLMRQFKNAPKCGWGGPGISPKATSYGGNTSCGLRFGPNGLQRTNRGRSGDRFTSRVDREAYEAHFRP